MSSNLKALCNLQKKDLNVSFDFSQKTNITAVFIDTENIFANNLMNIPCKEGIAISGYAYDCVNDCYIKECINYFNIGTVQGASFLRCGNFWETRIPLSQKLCMKLLNKTQKKLLQDFIKINCYEKLSLEFLQMIED